MTKLDEIEYRTRQAWISSISGEEDSELKWHDIDLIFRAVRQLGAVADWADFVAVECESGVIETECDEEGVKLTRSYHDKRIAKGIRRHWNKIDPDVLALLEE